MNRVKLTGAYPGRQDLKKIVEIVFEETGKTKDLNIAFLSRPEIGRLNLKYRKQNIATDVLTFDYGDEADIVLCLEKIQDLKDEVESLETAVRLTLSHGVLHALGYDHETEDEALIMRGFEEKIMKRVK